MSGSDPEGPEQSLTLARHFLDVGRPERALEVLRRGGDAGARPEAWRLRGRALVLLDRPADAAKVLEQGLALEPEDTEMLYLLAYAETCLGNLPGAERHILEALRLNPTSAELLAAYAEVVARAGQFAKSRALLERAEGLDPECTSVMRVRALVATLEGKDREAVRHARSWVAEQPDDAHAHVTAAATLENAGRSDAGFRHAREAVTLDARVADHNLDLLRRQRLMSHWTMAPLRLASRLGPAVIWGGAVAIMLGLRALGLSRLAGGFALVYLVFVIYTWVVPPIMRRILMRRPA